jgi:tRNA-guanine family transglycosylase
MMVRSALRGLATRSGQIPFPAYIPVTTFGSRYPLDDLVRPYLPRLAHAVMVSYHYAHQMKERPRLPVLVDSGGFVGLFEGARVFESDGLGVIELRRDDAVEVIHPRDVLELQERVADVAFSLDIPIPVGMTNESAHLRRDLTIANARWAVANRRRRDLPLYGGVQGWDVESYTECARDVLAAGVDGLAIGGLVPRTHDPKLIASIVGAVRKVAGDHPVHAFGLGKPELVDLVCAAGADSVDSSSYVRLAADGRLWSDMSLRLIDPSPTDRLHLALCNLATASGRALPLTASRLGFTTRELAHRV